MSEIHRRYLFVCAANMNRSPTAVDVFRTMAARNSLEVEAGSAGISPLSANPVTKAAADRADLIFVMEDYMARELETRYGQDPAKIICLNIPDIYERDDPTLVRILTRELAPYAES
jgi:predicted protein tyrosine phosphatase